jgi:hypothetical protein
MSLKDWIKCVVVGVLTISVVALVMMGCQALIIDTGRAILH